MYQSLRSSHLVLRLGLAAVFLWLGVSKFIDPQHWLNAWVPLAVQDWVGSIGMAPRDLVFLQGIVEVLIAASLATGYFIRVFSLAAVILVLAVNAVHGPGDVMIRDIAVIAGLISLALWPERQHP